MNRHHAFVIEAEAEEGIAAAQVWAERELGMNVQGNPDVVVQRYGLLPVDEARRVTELATGKAFTGDYKVVIIAAVSTSARSCNLLTYGMLPSTPSTVLKSSNTCRTHAQSSRSSIVYCGLVASCTLRPVWSIARTVISNRGST